MELYLLALLISNTICIAFCEQYEMEFLSANIFSPCEGYPNHSMNTLFDMSNIRIEQSEQGSVIMKGYGIILKAVVAPVPVSIEVYKKVRGTWQPTIYSQKRPDLCTAWVGKGETWHSYLKNTPQEQLTCPFQEGQRLDFNVNEPTYVDIPSRGIEGEYNVHIESGHPNENFYICTDIFVKAYKA